MINLSSNGTDLTKELKIQLDKFDGGTNLLVSETRLKLNEANQSTNLMLVQDGLWKPRWGTSYYGGDAGGSRIDGFCEYIKTDGTRQLILIANGKAWLKSESIYTEITGATFTAGVNCQLLQINDYLYITNRVDPIGRYNGTVLSTYVTLSTPTWAGTPITLGAGLSAGSYNLYYQITALNDIGETVGNDAETVAVNIPRDEWVDADEYVTLTWNTVSGASRYQIYFSDEEGYECLIASTTGLTYDDDSIAVVNTNIEVPDTNTTGGPLLGTLWLSDNRLFGTYDPNARSRVYFSGTAQFLGIFSDYYGGGYIDLEKGGRHSPKAGIHFHDGKGVGRSTVFCSTPDGRGSVWQISIGDITVGEDTFAVPSAYKLVGSVGTDSPFSLVNVENDVFFFNKKGVFVLGNEPQYWGVLRTNELSVRIRPFIQTINWDDIDDVSAYYYDSKVFFSVSTTSTGNNVIFYYDRERKCWICYWSTGVTRFGEFTDSSNISHFLGGMSTDGYLVEFSEAFQGDLGVKFSTNYTSPRIPVNKDWTKYAKIKRAYIRLGEPQGEINFSVRGTEKTSDLAVLGSETLSTSFSETGLGWDQLGSVQLGATLGTPTSFAQGINVRFLKINKRLRDIQFIITTNELNSMYSLYGLQAKGFPLDTKGPSSEQLS